MGQKKIRIVIGIFLGVALAALIALVAVIIARNSRRRPEEFFYIPKGSVQVWRVTAVYRTVDDHPRYCYEKNTIDELGRYETETAFDMDGEMMNVIRFSYDGETKSTAAISRYYQNGEVSAGTDNTYDPEGRILGSVFYSGEDTGLEKYYEETIIRDEEGNVLTDHYVFYYSGDKTVYHEDYDAESRSLIGMASESDGPFQISSVLEFDEQRRKLREYHYTEKKGKILTWNCEYREDGSRTVTEYYTASGDMYVKEYDGSDRIRKETYYNSEGEELSSQVYEYTSGESGSTEKITCYVGGEMRRWTEHEYNLQGDEIAVTSGGPAGAETTHIDIRYDGEGRILSRFYDSGQSDGSGRSFCEEFDYDAYGNMIRHSVEKEDGTTEVWEYEYTPYVLTAKRAAEADQYYVAKEIDGP